MNPVPSLGVKDLFKIVLGTICPWDNLFWDNYKIVLGQFSRIRTTRRSSRHNRRNGHVESENRVDRYWGEGLEGRDRVRYKANRVRANRLCRAAVEWNSGSFNA